jgi:hypothetical protein
MIDEALQVPAGAPAWASSQPASHRQVRKAIDVISAVTLLTFGGYAVVSFVYFFALVAEVNQSGRRAFTVSSSLILMGILGAACLFAGFAFLLRPRIGRAIGMWAALGVSVVEVIQIANSRVGESDGLLLLWGVIAVAMLGIAVALGYAHYHDLMSTIRPKRRVGATSKD